MSGGRTTYVEPYVKSDGTKVKGHIRHVHGEEGGSGGSASGTGGGSPKGAGAGGGSPSKDWSELPGRWRDGAGKSKPPRGGIDPRELVGSAVCEVSDNMLHVTMPMPSPAPEHPTIEEVTVRMSDPATQEMLVATYKRGQVSRTRNQRKWLAAEMSDADREQLARDYDESVLKSNKVVFMSRHLKDKMARGELSVPQDVVEETMRSFGDSFVEYNETEFRGKKSRRVLLRNNSITRQVSVRGRVQDANLCIVLDIDSCCMVTAYWNSADDHHDTLNRNRYEQGGKGKGRGGYGKPGSQGQFRDLQGHGHPQGPPPGQGSQGGGGKRRRRRRRRGRHSGNGLQEQATA